MSFDVASVKPTKTDGLPNFNFGPGNDKTRGGRLSATFPLQSFINSPINLHAFRQLCACARAGMGARGRNYEIDAKAQGNPTKDQMRLMLQSLLADRFKLAVHFETRQLPVLALRQVTPGKLGTKMLPHSQGPPCPDYERPVFGATPPDQGKIKMCFHPFAAQGSAVAIGMDQRSGEAGTSRCPSQPG